jgi:hypothetical protein
MDDDLYLSKYCSFVHLGIKFGLGLGFPLSQAVWLLENMVVYNLAGYESFRRCNENNFH